MSTKLKLSTYLLVKLGQLEHLFDGLLIAFAVMFKGSQSQRIVPALLVQVQ